MKIGNNIKKLRESLFLTQEDLVSKIREITQQKIAVRTLSRAESGEKINGRTKNLICAGLSKEREEVFPE